MELRNIVPKQVCPLCCSETVIAWIYKQDEWVEFKCTLCNHIYRYDFNANHYRRT